MSIEKTCTLVRSEYYRVPISLHEDFDVHDLDNPANANKIDSRERDKICFPQRFFEPVSAQVEIIEVDDSRRVSDKKKIDRPAIAMSDDEVLIQEGNVVSIAIDEENENQIEITSAIGTPYYLEGKEATDFLNKFDRNMFVDAPNLLFLYDRNDWIKPVEEGQKLIWDIGKKIEAVHFAAVYQISQNLSQDCSVNTWGLLKAIGEHTSVNLPVKKLMSIVKYEIAKKLETNEEEHY